MFILFVQYTDKSVPLTDLGDTHMKIHHLLTATAAALACTIAPASFSTVKQLS